MQLAGLVRTQKRKGVRNGRPNLLNRSPGLDQGSQGWPETFSLDSYCPHPSNESPVRVFVIGCTLSQIREFLQVVRETPVRNFAEGEDMEGTAVLVYTDKPELARRLEESSLNPVLFGENPRKTGPEKC